MFFILQEVKVELDSFPKCHSLVPLVDLRAPPQVKTVIESNYSQNTQILISGYSCISFKSGGLLPPTILHLPSQQSPGGDFQSGRKSSGQPCRSLFCLDSLRISKFRKNLPGLPDCLASLRMLKSPPSPGAYCLAPAEEAKGGYIPLGESSSSCNI